jgi:hypothetical protein
MQSSQPCPSNIAMCSTHMGTPSLQASAPLWQKLDSSTIARGHVLPYRIAKKVVDSKGANTFLGNSGHHNQFCTNFANTDTGVKRKIVSNANVITQNHTLLTLLLLLLVLFLFLFLLLFFFLFLFLLTPPHTNYMATRADFTITLAARANMGAGSILRFCNPANQKTSTREINNTTLTYTGNNYHQDAHPAIPLRTHGRTRLAIFNTEMIWATQKRYAH